MQETCLWRMSHLLATSSNCVGRVRIQSDRHAFNWGIHGAFLTWINLRGVLCFVRMTPLSMVLKSLEICLD